MLHHADTHRSVCQVLYHIKRVYSGREGDVILSRAPMAPLLSLTFTAPLAAVATAASDVHSHRVTGAATIPFILLLAGIAFWPLLHRRSWERYYVHLSLGLGFAVFAYYSLVLDPHRMLHS